MNGVIGENEAIGAGEIIGAKGAITPGRGRRSRSVTKVGIKLGAYVNAGDSCVDALCSSREAYLCAHTLKLACNLHRTSFELAFSYRILENFIYLFLAVMSVRLRNAVSRKYALAPK